MARVHGVQKLLKRFIAPAIIIAAAGAAFFFSTEPVLDPLDRFRIIMGAILAQSLLLCWLVSRLFKARESMVAYRRELVSQHRAATYVNTLQGLWGILEDGAQNGGLDLEMRKRIYKAGNEQFALYREATLRER